MKDTTELSDELPKYDVQAIKQQGQEFMVSHAAALSVHQALHGALKNCDTSQIDPELKALISQVAQVVATKFGDLETSKISQESSEALSPTWFEELRAKVESGEILKFRGKWHDGAPIEFLKQHYKLYLDAKVLTQAHLKAIDKKLLDSIKHECIKINIEMNNLLPSALIFSKKMM